MTPEPNNLAVPGIHHITAVAASAAENLDFYTRVLQLHLVKQTVNFDDPFTYHLYYGDRDGRPGTILTFFPWEQVTRGTSGAGMVTAIAFAVPIHAIAHWCQQLDHFGIRYHRTTRFDEPVIGFRDPHGLPLELIGTRAESAAAPPSPAIAGLHSATLLLNHLDATQSLLETGLNMILEQKNGLRFRFGMHDHNTPGHWLDVVVDPSAAPGRPGGGTVHHIAFRTPDADAQRRWPAQLEGFDLDISGVRDRKYFQSIYFREPGGVLFEIATDPPGFAVDEDPDHLGTALKLPSRYEPRRNAIESQLPPLRISQRPPK